MQSTNQITGLPYNNSGVVLSVYIVTLLNVLFIKSFL